MAWWIRHWTSMPEVVGSISCSDQAAQLPNCTVSGSIGVQNVQHLEILNLRFDGVLSPGGNVRLVKSCVQFVCTSTRLKTNTFTFTVL